MKRAKTEQYQSCREVAMKNEQRFQTESVASLISVSMTI